MKTNVKAGVADGVSSAAPLGQKELRSETNEKSQRPVIKEQKVSSNRGNFKIK
jgi:hypothetical protein